MKKWFENIKIAQKLRTGFLFIAFLGVLVGAIGIINIMNMVNHQQSTYNQCTLGIQYSINAEANFLKVRTAIRDLYINYDTDKKKYCKEILKQLEIADTNMQNYSKTISDNQDQENFNHANTAYESYKDAVNQVLEAANAGKTQKDILSLIKGSVEESQKADEAFEMITKYNDSLALEKLMKDKYSAWATIFIMSGTVVIAFIIALLLGRYISGTISIPMQKFAAFAEILAEGDINVDKVIDEKDKLLHLRRDEVGILAGSFDRVIASTIQQAQITKAISEGDLTVVVPIKSDNDVLGKALFTLVERFNNLVTSIVSSANQVDSGAGLVSGSSVSLSQGATEQASSVEELTASLEEITSQTMQNAKNAQTTDELAKNIKEDAELGNKQMAGMLHAMDEINNSSDNIGKIIKVIEDIAFQTNILALNAAVEAARAGQHGMGFAVVADEVRNLAGQSAKAAKETAELIQNSIKKVEDGTLTANETAGALNKIVVGITKVSELIDNIALASNEQAAALEQINQGIMQVSQVVQSTAAASEESAAASEELSGQADLLKESVSVFKLNK